jgi:Cdc6-like AAA superfamily ATPase
MKFLETHFDDYISSNQTEPLHPKIEKIFKTSLPDKIENLKNIILYGPKGVGKYTQALQCIKKYSNSELKYEKRLTINSNKENFIIKISDIHFEVDMSLLGCNSKVLWNDIYNQITDVVSMRTYTTGIILCKYFHKIHSELLDIFYSYMHSRAFNKIKLFFIIITEHISFIPDNILNNSQIISIPRPSLGYYNKCINSLRPNKNIHVYANITNSIDEIVQGEDMCFIDNMNSDNDINNESKLHTINPSTKQKKTINIPNTHTHTHTHTHTPTSDTGKTASLSDNYKNLTSVSNIKNIIVNTNELTNPHECICNNIIESIQNPDTINYLKFRDILYEILIYDLDINECIWYILSCLIKTDILHKDNVTDVLLKTFIFFQYYNNNYRPIYHLENYMYNLITTINGYKTCS